MRTFGARNFQRSTRRSGPASLVANTAMAAAFLRALARLVEKHNHNPAAQTMLPTGPASAGEIRIVLRNLNLKGNHRHG
jgi:hypothetical protein